MTRFLRKFTRSLVFGAGLTAFFILLRFDIEDWLKCLCDGFSLSGALMICYGGLLFIRQKGGFSSTEYLFYWVKSSLIPFGKRERITYGEFCEGRGQVRVEKEFFPLLSAGAFYLSVAFVILFIGGYF